MPSFPSNLVQYELAVESALRIACKGRIDLVPPNHRELNEAFFIRQSPEEFVNEWLLQKRLFAEAKDTTDSGPAAADNTPEMF